MKAHINPTTNEIQGYYPEEINYPNLPPEGELVEITDEQHQQALEINANKWGADGPEVDPSLYLLAEDVPERSAEEKLASLGLTKDGLKELLK